MLSTRYWYEPASPAMTWPMTGITWNEYWRYALFVSLVQYDISSLLQKGVGDLAELEDADAASGLKDAERLLEDEGDVGAVADAEGNRVQVDRVVLDVLGERLRVSVRESDLRR